MVPNTMMLQKTVTENHYIKPHTDTNSTQNTHTTTHNDSTKHKPQKIKKEVCKNSLTLSLNKLHALSSTLTPPFTQREREREINN